MKNSSVMHGATNLDRPLTAEVVNAKLCGIAERRQVLPLQRRRIVTAIVNERSVRQEGWAPIRASADSRRRVRRRQHADLLHRDVSIRCRGAIERAEHLTDRKLLLAKRTERRRGICANLAAVLVEEFDKKLHARELRRIHQTDIRAEGPVLAETRAGITQSGDEHLVEP